MPYPQRLAALEKPDRKVILNCTAGARFSLTQALVGHAAWVPLSTAFRKLHSH